MNQGHVWSALLHCLILATAGAGCSLLYEAPAQCKSDGDCLRLAADVPALSGSYCEASVCIVPTSGATECDTHADCVETYFGNPGICREGTCIALQNGSECTVVINAESLETNEDVILIGAFSPLNDQVPGDEPEFCNYDMALTELQKATRGARAYGGGGDRPFVIIDCRADSPNDLDGSVDFLTQTLKVPVIIAALQASALEDQVARMIAAGTNTMVLSAYSSDEALLDLEDRDRLWHMLGTPSDLAPAYLKLIEEQMARLTESARVALVVNDVRAMGDIADAIEANLKIDGLGVTDAYDSGAYRRISIESLALNSEPNTLALSAAITDFKPNLFVYLTGPEVIEPGLVTTEVAWESLGYSAPPSYVLSHHLFNQSTLLSQFQGIAGIEDRVYGINYAAAEDSTLYKGYLSRFTSYTQAYAAGYENLYDTAHYALLSVIAAASGVATADITGDLAVSGFKRLIDPEGVPFELKPESLSTIAQTLELDSEATIYLTGTLGTPNFTTDGGRHFPATLWCLARASSELSFASDIVNYDASAGSFDGELEDCHPVVE